MTNQHLQFFPVVSTREIDSSLSIGEGLRQSSVFVVNAKPMVLRTSTGWEFAVFSLVYNGKTGKVTLDKQVFEEEAHTLEEADRLLKVATEHPDSMLGMLEKLANGKYWDRMEAEEQLLKFVQSFMQEYTMPTTGPLQ